MFGNASESQAPRVRSLLGIPWLSGFLPASYFMFDACGIPAARCFNLSQDPSAASTSVPKSILPSAGFGEIHKGVEPE